MEACCALAAAGSAATPSMSAAIKTCFIARSLGSSLHDPTLVLPPWMFPEQPRSGPATAGDEAVDQQQDEGADDRSDEACAFVAGPVPAERSSDPPGHKRSGDAEQDGDDAPARVAARHQELGDCSGQ